MRILSNLFLILTVFVAGIVTHAILIDQLRTPDGSCISLGFIPALEAAVEPDDAAASPEDEDAELPYDTELEVPDPDEAAEEVAGSGDDAGPSGGLEIESELETLDADASDPSLRERDRLRPALEDLDVQEAPELEPDLPETPDPAEEIVEEELDVRDPNAP